MSEINQDIETFIQGSQEIRPETQKAIEFFERVSSKFPRTEDGNLDASKLDYHFVESLDDSPESMYIRSKIPEVYLRGSKSFDGLYEYFYRNQQEEGKDSVEPLLIQLMNGNTSDYKALDGKVTAFIDFAKATREAIAEYCEPCSTVIDKLWLENRILPESMREDVKKYREIYDEYARQYDKRSYAISQRIHLDDDISEEERKAKEFIIEIYDLFEAQEHSWNNPSYNVEAANQRRNELENKLNELAVTHNQMLEEMERANDESLFAKASRLLGRKHEEQDPDAPTIDQIEQQISKGQSDLQQANLSVDRRIKEQEINSNIKNGFYDVIHNEIVPRIREKLEKSANSEESLAMLSYFFSEEKFSREKSRSALSEVNLKLSDVSRMKKEDYDAMLSNTLMTISASADTLIKYENWEKKGLVTATTMFRDAVNTIPQLKGEKPLSNKLAPTWSQWQQVDRLNALVQIYRFARKKENLDEYIKNAVYIWTKYNTYHPYDCGNVRTANHFLTVMLAERGIIVPTLYTSLREQAEKLSDFETEYKKRGRIESCDAYLEFIQKNGIDLTGQDRLRQKTDERQKEEQQNDEWQPAQP